MRTSTCLALVVVIFIAAPVPAYSARTKVYRCVLDSGHISYQQIACSNGDKPIPIRDKPSGWSPLRPGEQALLESYRTKNTARVQKSPARKKRPGEESKSCWNKRKQLEAIRSRLRRGYTLNESDALHRKQDDYRDYLRQFCS